MARRPLPIRRPECDLNPRKLFGVLNGDPDRRAVVGKSVQE
jgi:hypothetical protein